MQIASESVAFKGTIKITPLQEPVTDLLACVTTMEYYCVSIGRFKGGARKTPGGQIPRNKQTSRVNIRDVDSE